MTIPVVILCGGQGTRLRESTETRPKPMVEIAGRPILWHLMSYYSGHGHKDFVLCLGYLGDVIKRYFLDFAALSSDFTVDLSKPYQIEFHQAAAAARDWRVTCVETGAQAMTGARLARVAKYLTGDRFMLTYGDGLSDVDIPKLLEFHRSHGKLATVTGVRPPGRFGELAIEGDRVKSFLEKPARPGQDQDLINGGFFVFENRALEYVTSDDTCMLEREPLEQMARDGELMVHDHRGFWQCMDTYRESRRARERVEQRARSVEDVVTFAWTDRRVFVTGATGLLGSHLVGALCERRASVVCLVRDEVADSHFHRRKLGDRVTIVRGRLEDYELLERVLNEYECEAVFHCAAQAIVGTANRLPLSTWESNVRGTYNLLEACRTNHKLVARVVVASSDKAYGDQIVLPYKESSPLEGRFPYDCSKSCTDLIARSYFETYGVPVCITRCGNLFGPGDLNWNRIVPGTIRSALRGEPPVIRSDGQFVRDYVFVEDAVDAYVATAERIGDAGVTGEAFNFSDQKPMTVLEICAETLTAVGRADLEPVVLGQATHEIKRQYLDSTKARELLGWTPRHGLRQGLARTVTWYRTHLGVE